MPDSVPPTFDRSLLPAAELEFVVVADTHYMVDVGAAPLEFESRRHQGRRAGIAWQAIGALDPDFVVHMGDLVQEFPGRPDYERAVSEALGQIDAAGVRERCRFVVGNHDIGDRPDPTMPTRETTEESLLKWQTRCGPSWQTWEAAGVHFMTMNSQLLNTSLPAAREQKEWVEEFLAEATSGPIVLFLHMPPYLYSPTEPWLGHYDNVGEPDRSWLLDLVRKHDIRAMFTGHVHFQFFDHLTGKRSTCRYYVTPSTSFTRPGFSHLFTSPPPPEQGRDDLPKLGFFLCRLVEGRLDIHRIRTTSILAAAGEQMIVTPITTPDTAARNGFSLGVTLRHLLSAETQVPIAWPSVIRQPVRNDYPALACIELGLNSVRAPAADLVDPSQSRRLGILRDEGIRIQAVVLGEEEALEVAESLDGADRLEIQLPGRCLPDTAALGSLGAHPPLVLTPALPGQRVPGKQHHRTRIGYVAGELPELGHHLDGAGLEAAVGCRLDPVSPWDAVHKLQQEKQRRNWNIITLAELPGTDDNTNVAAVARATLAAAALAAPLFLEPLVDMDRTMDVRDGLLDACCNPRRTFDTARTCAALLSRHGGGQSDLAVENENGCEAVALGDRVCLVIPLAEGAALRDALPWKDVSFSACRLASGSMIADPSNEALSPDTGPILAIRNLESPVE